MKASRDVDFGAVEQLVAEIAERHPELEAVVDRQSGSVMIGAADERRLEVTVQLLKSNARFDLDVGSPQVGYRETVDKRAEAIGTAVPQTGASGDPPYVRLSVEPLPHGSTAEFTNGLPEGAHSAELLTAVRAGIEDCLQAGVSWRYPVVDVQITLIEIGQGDGALDVPLMQRAARDACQSALVQAKPILLEPIIKIDVVVPEEFVGDVLGAVNARGGTILGSEHDAAKTTIAAELPTMASFGFPAFLNSLTKARASFDACISHYEPVSQWSGSEPPPAEPASAALRA